jgi:hypothetical protein
MQMYLISGNDAVTTVDNVQVFLFQTAIQLKLRDIDLILRRDRHMYSIMSAAVAFISTNEGIDYGFL